RRGRSTFLLSRIKTPRPADKENAPQAARPPRRPSRQDPHSLPRRPSPPHLPGCRSRAGSASLPHMRGTGVEPPRRQERQDRTKDGRAKGRGKQRRQGPAPRPASLSAYLAALVRSWRSWRLGGETSALQRVQHRRPRQADGAGVVVPQAVGRGVLL